MIVTVKKSLAVICFLGQCYPALVGEDTPTGSFSLNKRMVLSDGYDGNVLQFHSEGSKIFAIHRPYKNDKIDRQKLLFTLFSNRYITKGCINVDETVYAKLWEQSHKVTLVIEF
jgi:hypothetical protein